MINKFSNQTVGEVLNQYPFAMNYFEENKIDSFLENEKTLKEILMNIDKEDLLEWAIDVEKLIIDFEIYMQQMIDFLGINEEEEVETLTIISGQNKNSEKEAFDFLEIKKSQIISIVGPTGSGKSRLLADIEWCAQNDTPTKRIIKINNKEPDKKWRFSSGNKLVAQLSQNMNFVMDLTVEEFLTLHAQSRMVEDIDLVVSKIIKEANFLAGEKFNLNTAITSLSGGQSRALMIADTAILSKSPIVLIDEIENAGIDRKKALELLVSEEKIVLMATHDPILALMADFRIVIKNGGIDKIIKTSEEEKYVLRELEKMDEVTQNMRALLRSGKNVKF